MLAAALALSLTPATPTQKWEMRDVNKVVRAVLDVGVAIGSFARQVGEQLLQISGDGVTVRTQEPKTTVSQRGRDTLIRLDFGGRQGKGPSDPSGAVGVAYTLLSKEARVDFDNFYAGGRQVKGNVGLELFPNGEPANVMMANLNVESQGIKFTGPAKVQVTTQHIILNNGPKNLMVGVDGAQFPVKVTNITLDPFKAKSLLPVGGTIYLKDPTADPESNPLGLGVTVTFLPTTPSDRIVQVSVAGNPPLRIEIPGIG